ncbi:hypothetical protein A6R68_22503 [Neotoma lepida]|uniref:Protein FAM221B n=1 Tax=Neotoma lepida TaxID=56216 RepID=A0A1A6HZN4_NEOLE|nr:hypothetical protein A6R68_22503 [Neotoma lepida]
MEADEITEDPQATRDANKRPSLKDPSAENLQEPTSPESPLELSSTMTSLQPPASGALFVTSTSLNPETEASEDLQEPSVSETPLESHTTKFLSKPPQVTSEGLLKSPQSVTSLEKAITEIPLDDPTYEIHISQLSQTKDVPELYSDEVPQSQVSESEHVPKYTFAGSEYLPKYTFAGSEYLPKYSFAGSEYLPKYSFAGSEYLPKYSFAGSEYLPKYSFAGPSTQANVDTSAEEEEAGEDELVVGTSNITAQAAKPEPQASKKKEKGVNYTYRPVISAKRAELSDVAKAMYREPSGARVNNLFQWEKDSALKAIQTGLYIGWRCPHYLWDCFRIGDESKCFCGHLLKEHQIISDLSVPCNVSQCRCLMFCFIPSRPEEVGEFWLKRRATFDPKAWRAQCRCKHTHEEHAATGAHPCRHRGCCCKCFESNFLCAACDRRWEEHETFFESEETRRRGGRPYGADYVPFAEMSALRDVILTNSDFEALQMQAPPTWLLEPISAECPQNPALLANAEKGLRYI